MRKVSILLIFSFLSLSLFSQTFQLGQVVVTATKVPMSLWETPSSTTLITSKDLEKLHVENVGDILENVLGLRITRYGSLGAETSISIRGSYSSHTLVLIDGRPINQPQSGSADISSLGTENIEKVEIVRGPYSALYGGGALGGVINIITKKPPEKMETSIFTSYGSWNTFITQFNHGGKAGKLGYLISGEFRRTDGARPHSLSRDKDFRVSLEYPFEKGNIYLRGGKNNGKLQVPGPKPADEESKWSSSQKEYGDDEVSSRKNYQINEDGFIDIGGKIGELKWEAFQNNWALDYFNWSYYGWPATHKKDTSKHRTISGGLNAEYHWEIIPDNTLVVGASYKNDAYQYNNRKKDLDSETTISTSEIDKSRYTQSSFIEDILRKEPLIVTFGGRWDNPSDYLNAFSPHIGCRWKINSSNSVKLSWGKAYRPPSLQDLYWPSTNYAQGNPDLKSEKSESWEIGWEKTFKDKATFSTTLFSQKIKDMILWAPTGPKNTWGSPKWWPDNIGKVKIKGIESNFNINFTRNTSLALNWTYLLAKQRRDELVNCLTYAMKEKEREAIYTPKYKTDLLFTYSSPLGIETSLQAEHVSKTKNYYTDWNNANWVTGKLPTEEKSLPAYTVVNLKLKKKWENKELFLAVDNLFDEKYSTRFGFNLDDNDYPMPGRSITTGFKIEF